MRGGMSTTICPCKNCEDRNASCHSTCKDYIDWKKQHDEMVEKERKASGIYPASYGGWVHTYEGYWRNHKTRRKR